MDQRACAPRFSGLAFTSAGSSGLGPNRLKSSICTHNCRLQDFPSMPRIQFSILLLCRSRIAHLLAIGLTLVVFCGSLFAQDPHGTLRGEVQDATGGRVTAAKITA